MDTTGRFCGTLSVLCYLLVMGVGASPTRSRGQVVSSHPSDHPTEPLDVLTPQQSKLVDDSVDRALAWLAPQQQVDGFFPSLVTSQPAVTSLCVLAFL